MIKAILVTEHKYDSVEIVDTDNARLRYFHRHDFETWEEAFGESWEPCFHPEKYEAAYQQYKIINGR